MNSFDEIKYYYKIFFSGYINFKGRATRKEFWILALCNFILGFIPFVHIVTFIPSIAVAFRRANDSGRRFLWLFLLNMILPFIAMLVAMLAFHSSVALIALDPSRALAAWLVALASAALVPLLIMLIWAGLIIYTIFVLSIKDNLYPNKFSLSPRAIDDAMNESHDVAEYISITLASHPEKRSIVHMQVNSMRDMLLKMRVEGDLSRQSLHL